MLAKTHSQRSCLLSSRTVSRPLVSMGVMLLLAFTTAETSSAQSAHKNGSRVSCSGGEAAGYSCEEVDLLSVLTPEELGATVTCGNGTKLFLCDLNDMWGWTDSQTGREYALVGRYDGTSFVDVTDPLSPKYLGNLPTKVGNSTWRDIKVYANHAYIVSERPGHGVQVFDLTQLRGLSGPPIQFSETTNYPGIRDAHNIAINEDTGFAYVTGYAVSNGQPNLCGPGLYIIDLSSPANPTYAGCFSHEGTGRSGGVGSGYSHDAQCVVYHGPDTDYTGREICFGFNENFVSIADVTDKNQPVPISKGDYPVVSYVHQGWLSEDHKYLFQDDEGDERGLNSINNTRTLVWDVQDLDDPIMVREFFGAKSIDHNLYIKGNYMYQSNYIDGLKIIDVSDPMNPQEVAHFDTFNETGSSSIWNGTWSNYPFFPSGTIAIADDVGGLFLVAPTMGNNPVAVEENEVPVSYAVASAYPNPFTSRFTLAIQIPDAQRVDIEVYDVLGRRVASVYSGVIEASVQEQFDVDLSEFPAGTYYYRVTGDNFSESRPIVLSR
jgi:choice-of-anchor B domain-containing protein